MARKQTYSLFGTTYQTAEEYTAARNRWLGYEEEQEQAPRAAIEQDSKVDGTVAFTILAAEQSSKHVWMNGTLVEQPFKPTHS